MTNSHLYRNSRFYESLFEHRFIHDISRYFAVQSSPSYLNVLKSEVDMFGFHLALSIDGITRHIQLKTRANSRSSNPYNISRSIWNTPDSGVIWIMYDSEKLEPIKYYAFGFSLPPIEGFPSAPNRPRFVQVKMQDAGFTCEGEIAPLAQHLFPGPKAS